MLLFCIQNVVSEHLLLLLITLEQVLAGILLVSYEPGIEVQQ